MKRDNGAELAIRCSRYGSILLVDVHDGKDLKEALQHPEGDADRIRKGGSGWWCGKKCSKKVDRANNPMAEERRAQPCLLLTTTSLSAVIKKF